MKEVTDTMVNLVTVVTLLAAFAATNAASPQYWAVIPKELRTDMEYKVDVILLQQREGQVSITVSIVAGTNVSALAWTNAQTDLIFETTDSMRTATFQVPAGLSTQSTYTVFLEFDGLSLKPVHKEVKAVQLKSSIFVLTDRGIYKPGDLVHFRVLIMDKDLKPKKEKFHVQIKDRLDNILMNQAKNGNANSDDHSALLDGTMQVSDDPILGNYTVFVETDSGKKTQATFIVSEYVLPKFSVDLSFDKDFAVTPNVLIKGKAKATYTYGKMVKGIVKIFIQTSVGRQLKIEDREFTGMIDFDIALSEKESRSGTIKVIAVVEEVHTGILANDTKPFSVYTAHFAAMPVKPLPLRFEMDDGYSFFVRLTDPRGGALTDWDVERTNLINNEEASHNLKHYQILVTAATTGRSEYTQTVKVTENPMTITIPKQTADGDINFDTEIKVQYLYLDVHDELVAGISGKLRPTTYKSNSKAKLQVDVTASATQGRACITITPADTKTYYQIINNFDAEEVQIYSSPACFELTEIRSPEVRVVAYTFRSYGDDNEMELLTAYDNYISPWEAAQKVTVAFDPEEVKPGQNVTILVHTTGSNSIVCLSGIDKSLTFLANGNDIKPSEFEKERTGYRMFDRPSPPPGTIQPLMDARMACYDCNYNSYQTSALQILRDSGLEVITDAAVYETYDYEYDQEMEDGVMFAPANRVDGVALPKEDKEEEGQEVVEEEGAKLRTEFPDTWLWDIVETRNGDASVELPVPDTITSWVVNAVAFDSIYGLGVAETKEVRVFQEFFVSMNLPYSIVRQEEFTLEILVFNYKSTQLTVRVSLQEQNSFEIRDQSKRVQTIQIESGASGAVEIPIKATQVGDMVLNVSAVDTANSKNVDLVLRKLMVKPEGREVLKSKEMMIIIPDRNGITDFDLSLFFTGETIIEDSLRMYLRVTGAIMGPALDNIDGKIRMPYGCGEQNIMSLTPGLFVGKYLKAMGLFDKYKTKVKTVCEAGYIKELIYRHKDGSFSAFGNSAEKCGCGRTSTTKGSTWLTAYVLKTFSVMAYEQLTLLVSDDVLNTAYEYLVSVFRDNVGFVEMGTVIHKEMQGGTGSTGSTGTGFTAFCLIAIMDYRSVIEQKRLLDPDYKSTELLKINNIISKATTFLKNSSVQTSYLQAIVAYGLAKAGELQSAKELLTQFELPDPDNTEPSTTTQPIECIRAPCLPARKMYYRPKSEASKIEMNGYALMAYVTVAIKDDNERTVMKEKATEILAWIISQRGTGGVFSSTQDTAVALDALSQYAIAFPETRTTDFKIRATSGGGDVSRTITMNNDNYMALLEEKLTLTEKPEKLSVVVEGSSGTAFATIVAIYNVDKDSDVDVLWVAVEPKTTPDNKPILRVKVKANPDYNGNATLSSMVVCTLSPQSGMKFKKPAVDMEKKLAAKKFEVDPKSGDLTVYYMIEGGDNFKEMRTVDIEYEEEYVVTNRQSAQVIVRDYYDPENNKVAAYNVPEGYTGPCMGCPTTGVAGLQLNMFLVISACVMLVANYIM